MLLSRLVKTNRAEMRADFRQYYGCSFDAVVRTSVIEAADLVAMLPRGSRTLTVLNPELAWEQEHYLLANIANSLSILVWAQTKDGAKNRNRPKPIMPPKSTVRKENTYSVDEYKKLLSRPRKEV